MAYLGFLILIVLLFGQDYLLYVYYIKNRTIVRWISSTLKSINTIAYVILVCTFLIHSYVVNPKLLALLFSFFAVVLSWLVYKQIMFLFLLIRYVNLLLRKITKRRCIFCSKLYRTIAYLTSSLPVLFLIYGIAFGRWDFKVNQQDLFFDNLPESFEGYRLVQISDIHAGGFILNPNKLRRAVCEVNSLKPNLVLFTGDMVTKTVDEMEGLTSIIASINSFDGKYVILGNHDYGSYARWSSIGEREKHQARFIKEIQKTGFVLLNDSSVVIKRNSDSIFIIGMENWGRPLFPQYGNIDVAINGVPDSAFKILMSHDPDFWIDNVKDKRKIELTLSGHSHGMQMGIEYKGKHYSPASWKYENWGGLYGENQVLLYVNKGLGYVGLPARIGMPPEITLFVLHKKVSR